MFDRKRKTGQYRFLYGKSPVLRGNASRQGFRTQPKESINKFSIYFKKFRKFGILGVIVVALAFSIYGIFFSNYFTITEITLKNKEIENQNIADKIKKTIDKSIGRNILFADTKSLELKVLTAFPELQKVTLEKKYPHSLLIEFSEYPLVANIINESSTVKKSFIINAIGYAVKENYEDKNLPYIRIKSDEPINPKNIVIDSTKLTYLLNAKTYFEEKFGMRVVEILYKPTAREMHLLTEKKFYIWLDIQRPFEQQFKKLKKALIKLNIYQDPLEYIDLRIAGNNGDKIIYKRRQS